MEKLINFVKEMSETKFYKVFTIATALYTVFISVTEGAVAYMLGWFLACQFFYGVGYFIGEKIIEWKES